MRNCGVHAVLLVGLVRTASADPAPSDTALPERWAGVPLGEDRTGDLRPEAGAILDAIAAAAQPLSVADVADVAGGGRAWSASAATAPSTIRVWRRGLDGSTASCSGRVDVIPFDRYVKGVLPHEWIASWHPEALKAGAVAIRSYAAAWIDAGGKYDCADLDDTTASQVYRDEFFDATDAAVEATGDALVTRDGAVVFAEYSAENGDPTEMDVAEPLCTGRARNGHGRGTCQWGTQRWALDGRTWDWMMLHYYPGASVEGGPPALAGGFVADDRPMTMIAGDERQVWVEFANRGTAAWSPGDVFLGTSQPRDRDSPFFDPDDWTSTSRATAVDATVEPGAVGRFTWRLRAPDVTELTTYTESFELVASDGGGFGSVDEGITWTIAVHPRPADGEDAADGAPVSGGCGVSPPSPSAITLAAALVWADVLRRSRRRRMRHTLSPPR